VKVRRKVIEDRRTRSMPWRYDLDIVGLPLMSHTIGYGID
jgi:hypothetical protein